jgi:N-acetylglucosaminyl-diphospho-decaprenol L-rhamnosyltransferase
VVAPLSDAPFALVVVNYESGSALTACVQSFVADDSAGGAPEVVVVDNGSSDGSTAGLLAAVGDVRVLTPPRNLGYAVAANRGIAATTAPVVAVCNPDLRVAPGTAAAILECFTDAAVGAAGPRVKNADGSTYPSGRLVPTLPDAIGHTVLATLWPENPFSRRYRQLDADPAAARDVDWVSGAAIWLRRDALDSVGGWDEGFFMYVEDVDLCWRLRRAGWRVRYEPGGSVTHVQGLSTRRHPYRMIIEHHRSSLRFAAKRWVGPRRLLLAPAAVLLGVRALLAMAVHACGPRSGGPKGSR